MDLLTIVVGILIWLAFLAFTVAIFAEKFKVRYNVKLQQAQVTILAKIAKQQGVDNGEVNNILRNVGLPVQDESKTLQEITDKLFDN